MSSSPRPRRANSIDRKQREEKARFCFSGEDDGGAVEHRGELGKEALRKANGGPWTEGNNNVLTMVDWSFIIILFRRIDFNFKSIFQDY